jgi:hypothetical protein
MLKQFGCSAVMAGLVFAGSVSTASAQNYVASPWTFVGTAAQCGVAGSKIVTSSWMGGLGLPDNGVAHPSSNKKEVHEGLLLSKHGPTGNCSSAGADILGWTPGAPLNALGFDVRKGSACGAGAPRFSVRSGTTYYFFGCTYGNIGGAPQDPANWDRVEFTAAGAPVTGYPGAETFVFGVTPVDEIFILIDEGTDTPTFPDNPAGIGLAVVDNIRINNTFITKKKGNPIQP